MPEHHCSAQFVDYIVIEVLSPARARDISDDDLRPLQTVENLVVDDFARWGFKDRSLDGIPVERVFLRLINFVG